MIFSRSILKILGALFLVLVIPILACMGYAWTEDGGVFNGFFYSLAITVVMGLILFASGINYPSRINRRQGYLIVTTAWLGMGFVFSLPYLFALDLSLADSVFESMSGLTTTGATIFNDIESLPKSILVWRSLSQWIGGMGIIVLTIALLPLLGVGGVELFTAEAPGPTSDKIHPRIQEVAKRLWAIYVGLTVLLFGFLCMTEMSPFDAANHALTTMATGGFSTKNASVAHFNSPAIEYIITVFMLLAGVNYTVLFFLFAGKWDRLRNNEEFRTYLLAVLFVTMVVFAYLYFTSFYGLEESFRKAIFQVVSVITTTGFGTADYVAWGSPMAIIFFLLLFAGASAGSTSGGIKIIRHLVMFKNSSLEFNRLLHPKAMIRTKINGSVVSPKILTHIMVFALIYVLIFFAGVVAFTFLGTDLDTALGIAATSIGNVGPGIGEVGPSHNFSALTDSQKWVSQLLMLLGRLEIFSVLILFTPHYWRT